MFYIDRFPALVPPVIIFLLAFFLGLHGTAVARRLSLKFGFVDPPAARKPQASPVPCIGGIAIVAAVSVSLLLTYGRSTQVQTILLVGGIIALVGLLDDVASVRATVKLLALAAGCAVLHVKGIGLNRTPFPLVNYLLTFLWVAGVSSAFNAIDNADGLAGSVCFVSAVSLFLIGWATWQIQFSFLAMALAGAVLGFLHYNVRPARIYMGDSGSFFLGYILSVLVIFGEWSPHPARSFAAGCLVLGMPIYDLSLTALLRVRHGIVRGPLDAISYSDRDHLSHRLLRLGFSHGQMVTALCLLSAVFCALAAAVPGCAPGVPPVLIILILLALAGLGVYLDKRTSTPDLWVNRERRD